MSVRDDSDKCMKRLLKIWLRLTLGSFQVATVTRAGALVFIVAKLLRFLLFLLVVILIVSQTKVLAGYNLTQSLIFFMTFNVIDTLTQLLFRDVYRFRPKIISGDFDLNLVQPVNALGRVLLGGADPMDLVVLVPYSGLLIYFLLQIQFSFVQMLTYLFLIINGLLIATAFHILVLALGILTTEIDHAVMIYRDLESMARFPVDIYKEPLRGFITFIIPVGIMMTFPPKALFGQLSYLLIISSFMICGGLLWFSLFLWQQALKRYTSAPS